MVQRSRQALADRHNHQLLPLTGDGDRDSFAVQNLQRGKIGWTAARSAFVFSTVCMKNWLCSSHLSFGGLYVTKAYRLTGLGKRPAILHYNLVTI
jgi:hypothetical protein